MNNVSIYPRIRRKMNLHLKITEDSILGSQGHLKVAKSCLFKAVSLTLPPSYIYI